MLFGFDGLSDAQKRIVAAKGWETLTAGDVGKVIDSYSALEARVGADNIAAPKDGKLTDFFRANAKAFGVPDAAEGYELNRGDIPAEQWNGDTEAEFRALAHAKGWPQSFVSDAMNFMVDRYKAELEAGETGYQTAVATERAALDKEWGQAKAQNTQIARAAAEWAGLDAKDVDALQSVIGHKKVMLALHKIGEGLGEDALKSGGMGGGFGNALTPQQAHAEITRMLSDKDVAAALQDKQHPRHGELNAKWRQLEAIKANAAA